MPSLQPIGGAIQLNLSAGGAATAVPLQDGGFVIVYRVANGPDVFRLFDSSYQPLTDEVIVTTEDFLAPQAAALNDGRFVVTWLNQSQTIQAAIYDPDGTLSAGSLTVALPTDASFGLNPPRIVGNGFGGFTAIWQDNATIDGVTRKVFVQSFDGDGNTVGDPIVVSPPAGGPSQVSSIEDFRIAVTNDGTIVVAALVHIDGVASIMHSENGGVLISLAGGDPSYVYTNPQVVPLAAGGFVITYNFVDPALAGSSSQDANWTTGGSVFTNHGTRHDFAVGTTVTTTANGTFGVDPSVITPLADGGFVVTFEPLTSPLGDGYLIDAQQFDAFGNAVGPVVLVAPQGFLPNVTTSANSDVLDTYQFGTGIFLQAYSSVPTPLGVEPEGTSFGLNSVVSANSPGVAPLSTGGFVVVYEGANHDAYGQIYGYDRQPVGGPFTIAATGMQPVVSAQTNATFLVAWTDGTRIMGAVYDNDGTVVREAFSMSGDASSQPVLDPALNPTSDGGYSMAYETDLQSGGAHQVTIQVFDGLGNAIGASVSQTYQPTNPLAPPKIAALEKQLFGSITVIGVGNSIFAAIVSAPPGGSSGGGQNVAYGDQIVSVQSFSAPAPTANTVQVSGGDDAAARAGCQVAELNDGNVVVVWNEAPANLGTWQIVGQIMTPEGNFVGGQFTLGTALPNNSAAAQIALSALPDGGFLVTYDSGNTTLASQRFDPTGAAIGAPVLMTGYGQANVVTTVLSDGTLLLMSDNSPVGGGVVTGATFSLPAIQMMWTGSAGNDLSTAANWDVGVAPDSGHGMNFASSNGGTLTGTASGQTAAFSNTGGWTLSGVTLQLTQGLTGQSTLTVNGGTLTGGGTAAIGGSSGATLLLTGGGLSTFQNTTVGTNANQSGTLTLTGLGTTWTDTGGLQVGASDDATKGSAPGHGAVTVTQSAHLNGGGVDVLGVTAGSEGELTVTNGGQASDAGLVAGEAGTGVVTVSGGTLTNSGSLVLGHLAGAHGTLTVTGSNALVSGSGQAIVGDAGTGSLSIHSGATVITTPGTVAGLTGAVIANAASGGGSSVTVIGAGSNWQVTGTLVVGNAGFGSLAISQSGSVTASALNEAAGAGGGGIISVSGTGSALTVTGALSVGGQASGGLSILNGATVTAASATVGDGASSSGNIDIEGVGSLLIVGTVLNVGGVAGGKGVITVGVGAELKVGATIVTGVNGILNNLGGTID
ncbi:MAG: hypothetical protein EXR07_18855, partial [Acetobacteraceae bacterium]|nr:hypothetical protein [Acetobacteraceae bacterium]